MYKFIFFSFYEFTWERESKIVLTFGYYFRFYIMSIFTAIWRINVFIIEKSFARIILLRLFAL